MLFNSYIFILLFFPLCLCGWFLINRLGKGKLAQVFLLAMSLWFYGYFEPGYLAIILGSILGNFLLGRVIEGSDKPALRKWLMIGAVVANLSVLFFYKYLDFCISNVNFLVGAEYPLRHIVLPLGISFFTFQQMSYILDAYRGETPGYGFLEYACYVAYFPQLVAGPIVTHDELIPQLRDPEKLRFDWESFARGLFIFALGLTKKVLVADLFGRAVNWGFDNVGILDSTNAILVMLGYTFQVYFDFSGYCDMAIGLGRMMHLELPLNFDSPYKACNITEFWDRWHKTLTRFFTSYLYIPLGGNRKGRVRTYLNVMIVFLASGFWHGANWTFVLWGILHGALSVLTRHLKKPISRIPRVLTWLGTFLFLNVSWIFFRADSIAEGLWMLSRVFSGGFGPINNAITNVFNIVEVTKISEWVLNIDINRMFPNVMTLLIYSGTLLTVVFAPNAYEVTKKMRFNVWEMLITVVLLVWCILSLEGVSTFLYFNF